MHLVLLMDNVLIVMHVHVFKVGTGCIGHWAPHVDIPVTVRPVVFSMNYLTFNRVYYANMQSLQEASIPPVRCGLIIPYLD